MPIRFQLEQTGLDARVRAQGVQANAVGAGRALGKL